MSILVNNVSKKYGFGNAEFYALTNINLTFEKGECVAIIGASGSGKTTLLNLLGGLDFPSDGDIIYNNTNICSLGDKDLSGFRLTKIGFVFQFFNLIPELTVYENIVLPLLLSRKKIVEKEIKQVINSLGLEEKALHYPYQLSGGQQQRVAIARALINNPEILLCDEPTGNLDEKMGMEVISILTGINSRFNTSVIIVTHDVKIASHCNRIIELSDGKILSDDLKM